MRSVQRRHEDSLVPFPELAVTRRGMQIPPATWWDLQASETWMDGRVPLATHAVLFDVELLHVVIRHFLAFLKGSV